MLRQPIGIFCTVLCCSLPYLATTFAFTPRSDPKPVDRQFLKSNYRQAPPSQGLQLKSKLAAAAGLAASDTLNVLAIRVDFVPDNNARTTGNGRFMLAPSSKHTIDPPPHDRAYFEAQMLALTNYYASVSRGKLLLRYQVYPAADTVAYHLDRPMAYYGPGRDDPASDQRLAELFRDSFQKADSVDRINFSAFDSFILFHAGVGEDFAEEDLF
ncbi:MAG: hypothetical protein ONA90_04985, partial [candidate division KSB1 bacterium]|nr:hypothetical protein [candidate division KSB1 bacterium]